MAELTNPTGDPSEPIRQRLVQHLQTEFFNEEMIVDLKMSYAQFLQQEMAVATRNEKKRLLQEALRRVCDAMIDQL